MPAFILKLGSAGFYEDDLPEQLPLGGQQMNVVRQFPGGNLQVQTLGGFDNQIQFSGSFYGSGAWYRAQAIDQLRINGDEVLMEHATITRYVIIAEFVPQYYNLAYCPYTITLQPTRKSGNYPGVGSTNVLRATNGSIYTEGTGTATIARGSSGSGTTAPAPSFLWYTIKHGDTLSGIAWARWRNANDWPRIAALNPGINPRDLQIGQRIKIPR